MGEVIKVNFERREVVDPRKEFENKLYANLGRIKLSAALMRINQAKINKHLVLLQDMALEEIEQKIVNIDPDDVNLDKNAAYLKALLLRYLELTK